MPQNGMNHNNKFYPFNFITRNDPAYSQKIANILGIVNSLRRPRGQFLRRIWKQWSNFSLESWERRTGIPNTDKITSNHLEQWFPGFCFGSPKPILQFHMGSQFLINLVWWVANYQRLRTTDLDLQYINSTVINLVILLGIKCKHRNWVSEVIFYHACQPKIVTL